MRIAIGVVLTTVGGLVTAFALAVGLVFATVLASLGTDGEVTRSEGTVSSAPESTALVFDGLGAQVAADDDLGSLGRWLEERGILTGIGGLVIGFTGPDGEPLFAGVADPASADDYLVGAPYSVAVRDGREWSVREVPGALAPPPPAQFPGWTLATSGSPAEIPAEALPGSTVVVANPDGSAGVFAAVFVAYRLGDAEASAYRAGALGLTSAAAGIGAIVGGAVLIVGGFRDRGPRGAHR